MFAQSILSLQTWGCSAQTSLPGSSFIRLQRNKTKKQKSIRPQQRRRPHAFNKKPTDKKQSQFLWAVCEKRGAKSFCEAVLRSQSVSRNSCSVTVWVCDGESYYSCLTAVWKPKHFSLNTKWRGENLKYWSATTSPESNIFNKHKNILLKSNSI